MKRLFNPPLPPFRKGGRKALDFNAILIMKRHTMARPFLIPLFHIREIDFCHVE
jgi:hypothetical protein